MKNRASKKMIWIFCTTGLLLFTLSSCFQNNRRASVDKIKMNTGECTYGDEESRSMFLEPEVDYVEDCEKEVQVRVCGKDNKWGEWDGEYMYSYCKEYENESDYSWYVILKDCLLI